MTKYLEADMLFLTFIIQIFVGTTFAGSAIVAALSMGFDSAQTLILSGAVGFLAAIPVSWYVAREISARVK